MPREIQQVVATRPPRGSTVKSSILSSFRRASKSRPCPVCRKPDWCLVSIDGGDMPKRAICARIESARRWRGAGYLHELGDVGAPPMKAVPSRFEIKLAMSTSFSSTANVAAATLDRVRLDQLGFELGVSTDSLRMLGVGWLTAADLHQHHTYARTGCWSFPMQDGEGHVCGIRLRGPDHGKFAVTGSRNGIFCPVAPLGPIGRLCVAEGESDTAALLDLGFYAIGTPGAGNADAVVVRLVRNVRPLEVVVVADNDPVGRQRALELGRRLRVDHCLVRVIAPPEGVKDARAWKQHGASFTVVAAVIAATPTVSLSMSFKKGGS